MMILAASGGIHSFVQFITVLIIFVFVLVITYFVTRWMAGFQKSQMTATNMEIMDTMRISQNKYLQIIRAGDKYFVIAVCKDTVTMLTELSEESIVKKQSTDQQNLSFQEALEKMKEIRLQGKKSTKNEK